MDSSWLFKLDVLKNKNRNKCKFNFEKKSNLGGTIGLTVLCTFLDFTYGLK